MKKYFLLYLITLISLALPAQTISVSAPSRVALGENFRIAYRVNTQNVQGFRVGNVPSEIKVIAGPYTSSESNFQMINGHASSYSSITYTYTLYADKNGTYTIPAAHARVGNKNITSRAVKITVSGNSSANNGGMPRMHGDDDEPELRSVGSAITGQDLFIKVSANKRRVYEQEPILLTYKVYTTVVLNQLGGEMPDLAGFHTQEVKLPKQKVWRTERINGRVYRVATWTQYIMYPQMTGKLEVPSITFKGYVVQKDNSVDPIEAYLNGGSGYVEVEKTIKAPGVSIQVDKLPARPTDFSGGVGLFNISAQLDKTEVKAGNPITVRVVIGGTGNLKLIKQPVVRFPKDFDTYDAKVTDKTMLTNNGVEGNIVYDFLAVPHNQGKYTIPAIEFTYYDTNTNSYKTIKTQLFNIVVHKGDGSSAGITDYNSMKAQDIHPIKTDNSHSGIGAFFGSALYWVCLLVPLIAFITLLIIFRKRALAYADVVGMRGKNANKVAAKHLKIANKLMLQGRQSEFYDEVLRALWGYVGDKLNMPVEHLSRENISDNLSRQGVNYETISKFVEALDECEYERYAPGDAKGNMNKTYDTAMAAILKIENSIKHNKKDNKALLILLFIIVLPASSFGITRQDADNEYKKANYQQAIKDYKELLHRDVDASLYYNLGNAYYRSDSITNAVIAYERALKLSPGDDDIRFNLQFARNKTIDRITPQSEMFFVAWYRSLVYYTSIDNWASTAIVAIILALIFVLVYLFSSKLLLRKVSFFGSIGFFIVFLLSNLFAYQQKQQLDKNESAVVIAPSVNVKNTPSITSTSAFVIHEGTHVDITDSNISGWSEIRLADGREGWVQTDKIEKI